VQQDVGRVPIVDPADRRLLGLVRPQKVCLACGRGRCPNSASEAE